MKASAAAISSATPTAQSRATGRSRKWTSFGEATMPPRLERRACGGKRGKRGKTCTIGTLARKKVGGEKRHRCFNIGKRDKVEGRVPERSEEHTSELISLMRITD